MMLGVALHFSIGQVILWLALVGSLILTLIRVIVIVGVISIMISTVRYTMTWFGIICDRLLL